MRAALSLAIGSILLTACGGDKGNTQNHNQNSTDYSKLQATPQNTESLVLVGDEKLSQHLKNGMRLQLKDRNVFIDRASGGMSSSSGAVAVPTAPTEGAADKGNFSGTNVHVAGVDEADYTKYDGSHWFIATSPQYYFHDQQPQKPGFQIVATDPATPDAEIVGAFEFDEDWGDVGALYLVQNDGNTSHVASIRNQWGNIYPALPGFPVDLVARPAVGIASDAIFWPHPQNSKVRVQLVDVTTPSAPTQDWEVELDGSLINSRKIGETLYLVTRFDPWLAELQYEYGDGTVREKNEAALEEADAEDLMPHYRIGDAEQPLSVDCYVQEGIKDTYGLSSLVHITAIDLAAQKVLGSACVNSGVEVMSMSLDALYLTGTVHDETSNSGKTVIHKFSLPETGPTYEATGSVTGSLGWRSDPVFRLHEHDGQLRVVTSSWGDTGPVHQLTILEQNADSLTTVSTLPNSTHPAPIGKPNEDIYSVRFQGDRAYIVTFQLTDPLYALDLSDPKNPKVAGELEIPGFATYMHPIGDHLLFTLGRSADTNGIVTGMKADLFDVAGETPQLLQTVDLGNGFSDALSDLRALSVMQNGDDQLRIALPITEYDGISRAATTGLQLLEVNGLAGDKPELVNAGMVVAADEYAYGPGMARGLLHNDAVFFTQNNAVWVTNWNTPKEAKGPITQYPIVCTAEVAPSLQVTVRVDGVDAAEICEANVTATQGEETYVLDALIPVEQHESNRGACVFIGPDEVGGLFDVKVELDGYYPVAVDDIFVSSTICHVQTQFLDVMLKLAQ